METYKIIRFFRDDPNSSEVIKDGLTLEEAKEHCSDPETSSRTCSETEGMERTRKFGPWFEAFNAE